MKCDIENNFIIAKLADGEDLFEGIGKIIEKYNVTSGIILSGIGMLRDFEIGYFNGKDYQKEVYEKPHELIALHGSIAMAGKKPTIHLHCGVARGDHLLMGGHLFGAKVAVLNELVILKLEDMKLVRKKSRKSGIMELEVDSD
jgi:hypothetical protein